MATIQYVAKRGLAQGHVMNELYALDIDIVDDGTERSTKVEKDVVQANGGAMEVLYHRRDVTWQLVFAPVRGKDMPVLREFLESTDGGESFNVDIYGQFAQAIAVKRIDTSYTETPFMRVGSAALDLFQVRITVIELT